MIVRNMILAVALITTYEPIAHADSFKCHVVTYDGKEKVYFLESLDLTHAHQAAMIKRFRNTQVKDVVECQHESALFRDAHSRELDDQTPR